MDPGQTMTVIINWWKRILGFHKDFKIEWFNREIIITEKVESFRFREISLISIFLVERDSLPN